MANMPLKKKYTQGGFDTGNHGKCTSNSGGGKKIKGKDKPILRGSRAQSFN